MWSYKFPRFLWRVNQVSQAGTVSEYQTLFERLLAKVWHLLQNRQVSCFISRLHDSINANVLACCPTILSLAIGLALLYEARNLSQGLFKLPEAQNNSVSVPVKRLSTKEISERRKKGLCFKCNEQFGPRHHCKKLFMIQACFNKRDADEEMEIIKPYTTIATTSIWVIENEFPSHNLEDNAISKEARNCYESFIYIFSMSYCIFNYLSISWICV